MYKTVGMCVAHVYVLFLIICVHVCCLSIGVYMMHL